MTPRFQILFAAFCGFACCAMLAMAYGFHQMEAGYLDMLAVLGAAVMVWFIADTFRDAPELSSDEDIDAYFAHFDA